MPAFSCTTGVVYVSEGPMLVRYLQVCKHFASCYIVLCAQFTQTKKLLITIIHHKTCSLTTAQKRAEKHYKVSNNLLQI